MITKLIDAEFILNDKKLPIVNSEIKILVNWDINLEKMDEFFNLKIDYFNVSGSLNWVEVKDNFRKKNTIEFSTDKNWKIVQENNIYLGDKICPISAKINFDKKEIRIII